MFLREHAVRIFMGPGNKSLYTPNAYPTGCCEGKGFGWQTACSPKKCRINNECVMSGKIFKHVSSLGRSTSHENT